MNEDDPAKMLYQLNNRLEHDMASDSFMTLFFGILDPVSRGFRYTSAAHDEPSLYRAATGSFETLVSTGLPLGAMEEMDFPEGQATVLNDGDVLLLCTDGILEAMNEEGELMGRERMQEVLADTHERSAEDITHELRDRTYAFMGEAKQRDDITIVTIKAVSSEQQQEAEAGAEELQVVDFGELKEGDD